MALAHPYKSYMYQQGIIIIFFIVFEFFLPYHYSCLMFVCIQANFEVQTKTRK